jgi:predicted membrane-bound spermidine synthase
VVKKFPHLFLVLVIEGGALMAVELMGAKLVAPFYGGSLYVWTAVLAITLLGLTLGYYIGGQLAKKRSSETKLFVILGVSALLVLVLPLTASIAMALTRGVGLIVGICITCFLLLLPPMLCFGMVGPLVVSLISLRLDSVGKTAGTVYFTSTLGGIVATFWLGLYFIPVAGLRVSTTLTGLALAALPALYLLKMLFGAKKEDAQPTKRSKRLSEKSTVKGRAKRSIYLFAVLEGATVMAVELLAARMVARYFGSSLYVWGTVIGFTLLALAIGYFAGGVIADKYSGPDPLLWVLLAASVFLLLMHVTAPLLTIAFANISPGAAVILVSMALILPPLLFMGIVPTFLVRRVSATAESAGANTGMVYTISSASGIVALPLFGFL